MVSKSGWHYASILLLCTCVVLGSARAQDPEIKSVGDLEELIEQGKYVEAEAGARELLAVTEAESGPDSLEVSKVLDVLVAALWHLGKAGETETRRLAERCVEIKERVLGSENPDLAGSLHRLAKILKDTGDYEDARALIERALEIRRKAFGPDHPETARSLNSLGGLLLDTGDYSGALPLFERSLAILEKSIGPDHPDIAAGMNNIGLALRGSGDYSGARTYFERALAAREKMLGPDHADVATSLTCLALVLVDMGDYAAAQPLHEQALTIREKTYGPDHPEVATSLNNLAILLFQRGDYAGARPLMERALVIQEKAFGPEHPEVAENLNDLATLLVTTGDYTAARPLLDRALMIREKSFGPDHAKVGETLNNLTYLFWATGNYGAARSRMERAVDIYERALGADHAYVARSISNLALILEELGDYEAARPLLERALSIWEKALGPDHEYIGMTLENLARIAERGGDYATARSLYERSLAIKEKALGLGHPTVGAAQYYLANVLRKTKEYAAARPLYGSALAAFQVSRGPNHEDVARLLGDLAILELETGHTSAAESLLAQAAGIFEVARLRAGGGLERATFLDSPYGLLAATRLALGSKTEAWPTVERACGRALADLLMVTGQRRLHPSERAREDSLSRELSLLEGQIRALQETAHEDTSSEVLRSLEKARTRLLEVEAAWSEFHRQIAIEYPVTEGQGFPLARVQASLREEAAFVGWVCPQECAGELGVWGYVIRSSGPVHWHRMSPSGENRSEEVMIEAVRTFRKALSTAACWPARVSVAGKISEKATDLGSEWIAPLASYLDGVEHLVVIPSGPILGVPIEAFLDSHGVPLGERYEVSYSPSATIFAWLQEQRGDQESPLQGRVLLVGDPPFTDAHLAAMEDEMESEGEVLALAEEWPEAEKLRSALAGDREGLSKLPRLPWTREELERVQAVVPQATILLGPNASEHEVDQLAESGDLRHFEAIHLATHALVYDDQPERSALVLSQVNLPDPLEAVRAGRKVYDGLVSAKEIIRGWDLHADLVTLSGCQTGLGREVVGEGYVGLAHAFLQAGARSLLVSLWRVEDEATALLMGRFYENLAGAYGDERGGTTAEPMSKVRALQEAKHWLRSYTDDSGKQPFEHPAYWSGFILIGAPQ